MIIYYHQRSICERNFVDHLRRGLHDTGIKTTTKRIEYLKDDFNTDVPSIHRMFRLCIVLYDKTLLQYIIFDYRDEYMMFTYEELLSREDVTKVLKFQYRPSYVSSLEYNYKIYPYVYFENNWIKRSNSIENLPGTKSSPVYFRGCTSSNRYHRKEFINSIKYLLNKDHHTIVDRDIYLNELGKSRLALSIPGHGNFCHREIESFAAKTPVIMPKYLNTFYNPLIPDFHYISIDVNWETDKMSYIVSKFCERYLRVHLDTEYLDYISSNAWKWYSKNLSQEYLAKILLEIMER